MKVNGTTQNNDESDFSVNQTLEPSDDQGSMMVSNESQNVSGDSAFSVSDSSSNVNNTLNSEQNVSNVLNESDSLDTDVVLIQSPKLLKNANITSTSSNAKGPDTTDTDNIRNFFSGGSFLKNLFEINGPTPRSINELLKKYQYLPYYSLFSLLTASTGRESVERMLEWLRQLQAKQVATTEGWIKRKEYATETQFSDAYDSEDEYKQLSARAGISPSGSVTQITKKLSKCKKALIITLAAFITVLVCVVTAGTGAGAGAVFMAGIITCLTLSVIGMIASAIVSATCKDPSTKAKLKEFFDLLNPVNALAEIVVLVAELFTDDEEKLKWVRLIARIIFIIIYIALTIWSGISVASGASALVKTIVAISGAFSGLVQIANGTLTLLMLEKQEKTAEDRLKLETEIAYCEKLQKDLDIIALEIDMIVELFTAAMDKIRAEYDRISRMIKETSDVKNMIARNIGA